MSKNTWRIMDIAWHRDHSDIEHHGEALMLACLFKVKKKRSYYSEESMKDLLVFKETK